MTKKQQLEVCSKKTSVKGPDMKVYERFKKFVHGIRHRHHEYGSRGHEQMVFRDMHCSRADVDKLGHFKKIFFDLNDRHKVWLDAAHKKGCRPMDYNDPGIIGRCGEESYRVSRELINEWYNLRNELEQFLEKKMFSIKYEELTWTGLRVYGSSGQINYYGDYVENGFDPGPAKRCATMLTGALDEMFSRRRLQRIESYTKYGLIAGISGLVISCIALVL